jgi:hypothetical protein
MFRTKISPPYTISACRLFLSDVICCVYSWSIQEGLCQDSAQLYHGLVTVSIHDLLYIYIALPRRLSVKVSSIFSECQELPCAIWRLHSKKTIKAVHIKIFCFSVSNYNAFCEEDHQCVMNNSRCLVPKCACKKGYRWEASKCVNGQGMLVKLKVILRTTASRAVCPGIRPPSGSRDQVLFLFRENYLQTFADFILGRLLWREDGFVVYSCYCQRGYSRVQFSQNLRPYLTVIPFLRLLRLAGLQRRYSIPPPHRPQLVQVYRCTGK